MVKTSEVRQTIIELNKLRDKFGYEDMPMKGVITMLEWLIRSDPIDGDSMLRGVFGAED